MASMSGSYIFLRVVQTTLIIKITLALCSWQLRVHIADAGCQGCISGSGIGKKLIL